MNKLDEVDDILKHHGVLGMKWGVRKDRLKKSTSTLAAKRKATKSTKGVANRSYISTSKKLNVQRRKIDKIDAKASKMSEDKVNTKNALKEARANRKTGPQFLDNKDMKKIYGSNLTPKQIESIRIVDSKNNRNKKTTMRILKAVGGTTLAVAVPVAAPAGIDYLAKKKIISSDSATFARNFIKDLKMSDYDSDDILQHHGVLGMKWGVRKDRGGLSKVGKAPSDGKSKAITKRQESGKRYSIPDKKSGHRVRLEASYSKRGFDDSHSEQLAARRIKAEKVIATVAAVAIVATAAYITKQEVGKRLVGVQLKAGTDLHYINALGDNATWDRRLYTSFDKGDTKKYKGLHGEALRKNMTNSVIYDTVLSTKEAIKAPSQREANKMFKEFAKTTGKDIPSIKLYTYNAMNREIADGTEIATKYVEFVKKKGYNSLIDANDQFISGYGAKKPLIIFDAAKSTAKKSQSIVNQSESAKIAKREIAKVYGKHYAKELAPQVALGSAVIGGTQALKTNTKYGAVNAYFKKHPKSKMSFSDVYNSLEQNKNNPLLEYKVNTDNFKKR